MKLSDLYSKLSYGVLSSLGMAGEGDGTIKDKKKPAIVGFANEALLRLYTRFPMKQNDVLIEMHPHITNYHLLRRFAASNLESTEPYLYIRDLPMEPFLEDVIKVLAVYDSFGRELPLNDPNDPEAVFIPEANVIQIPRPSMCQAVSITYQAKHLPLSVDDPDMEITLPDVLHAALFAYIGSMVYEGLEMEGSNVKAANMMAKFDGICAEAEAFDSLNVSESYTKTKFNSRGWV